MPGASVVDSIVLTVLLVDDDPDLCELLSRFLTRQGMKTLIASSGPQCLEIAENFPTIDVIVLDIMMPGMDGLEVCAVLKQRETTRGIPIILLTARGDEKTRQAGINLNVNAFLIKPVSSRNLLAHIQTHAAANRESRSNDHTATLQSAAE
jgi:DNA-binding response OmpR family regulator